MNIQKRYFGMTQAQIGILVGLALVSCVVIGIFGKMISDTNAAVEPASRMYTPSPTPLPTASPTPWPESNPISGWQVHTFASPQAQIWLPKSYIGSDTTTITVDELEKVKITIDDVFLNEDLYRISSPEVAFFAFDTASSEVLRNVYVRRESLDPASLLSMNDHLNMLMADLSSDSDRVVERQIKQMENFPAGTLVLESKVLQDDVEAFVSTSVHMIRVEDTMWTIVLRSGRGEYSDYKTTIEDIVNSFWVQREE